MGTLVKTARKMQQSTKAGRSVGQTPLSSAQRGTGATQKAATQSTVKKHLKGPY